MDYNKIYNTLIEYRKQNTPNGYVENHHILPKSLGGTDNKDNLVLLTGREHWVAHLLLHKIHNCQQTAFACHIMSMRREGRGIPQIRNSRLYEHVRKEHAKYVSKLNKKTHIGENNSQYGTMWICNLDLKENKKISKDDDIPDGWVKGRNKWKENHLILKRKRDKIKALDSAKRIFNDFEKSGLSLREYANNHYKYSHVSLFKLFKKYNFNVA